MYFEAGRKELDTMSLDGRIAKLLKLLFDRITRDVTKLLADRLVEYSKTLATCVFEPKLRGLPLDISNLLHA